MEETDRDLEMREPICSVETANSLELGFRNPPSLCTLSNASPGAAISKEKETGDNVNSLETLDEAGAVTSSLAGQANLSSDSVVASMELEKTSLMQSSLDSNEVSRNVTEAVCGPLDASMTDNNKQVSTLVHTTDNQNSDNSSAFTPGHGRNKKAESDDIASQADNEREKEEKGNSSRKRRQKRRKSRKSSRSMTVSQCLGAINKTSADIEFGILDALEIATKVAGEVAKEVDSGESAHSSSEEERSDESGQSGSEDSRGDDLHTGSPSKGLSVGENHSVEQVHVGAGGDKTMDEKNNKSESRMMDSDDVEESHEAAAAVSEMDREKSPCDFDLNQDIFPNETDVIMSCISTNATPIMSVSHSVSTSEMPAAALSQLERSLSGKGSAATSVFHPPSPHQVLSGESREKHVICRGIDLNVAEVGDDQVQDLTPWKHLLPSSSNSRDGESSHEANLRGSSRFNLDLNCMNEDADMPHPPSELKMETRLFLSHNGQQSASHVTPFSVAQQSGKEVNFDLNDRPQLFMDSRDRGPYSGRHSWSASPYGGHKLEEPGISILGAKVDVGRKDSVAQMASFLSNGKSLEPATGLYMGRSGNSLGLSPGVSFSPAPMYGYNGLSSGPPSMSSSPMYVPGTAIPYMVDSRGTPVMMPQMMSSTQYTQPPYPQQHLFMSLASGSHNGPVRPNFDQSSGFGVEMGNREPLSLRQFLSPEQSGAMGEHSGSNAEPSSSSSMSIGGKRKEPETRWEFPPWR
ncbi:unnamed protein product [Cochlearia groenlandica]